MERELEPLKLAVKLHGVRAHLCGCQGGAIRFGRVEYLGWAYLVSRYRRHKYGDGDL